MAKGSVTIRAAWITGAFIVIAALVTGLFQLLSAQPAPLSPQPHPPSHTAPPASASSRSDEGLGFQPLDSLTFSEYHERFQQLKDRNLERQEFVRAMVGTRIVWQGYVVEVRDDGDGVILVIQPSLDNRIELANVHFPAANWRTQLYALSNGDRVEVIATYTGNVHLIVNLQGHLLSRLE